ncbi:hypothetical protein BU17DRAFT_69017 [Hysterangium stoloniferum]|nr:hypothetical protein BU17DRAFT_69017 [Hysterangium stoloniferum]
MTLYLEPIEAENYSRNLSLCPELARIGIWPRVGLPYLLVWLCGVWILPGPAAASTNIISIWHAVRDAYLSVWRDTPSTLHDTLRYQSDRSSYRLNAQRGGDKEKARTTLTDTKKKTHHSISDSDTTPTTFLPKFAILLQNGTKSEKDLFLMGQVSARYLFLTPTLIPHGLPRTLTIRSTGSLPFSRAPPPPLAAGSGLYMCVPNARSGTASLGAHGAISPGMRRSEAGEGLLYWSKGAMTRGFAAVSLQEKPADPSVIVGSTSRAPPGLWLAAAPLARRGESGGCLGCGFWCRRQLYPGDYARITLARGDHLWILHPGAASVSCFLSYSSTDLTGCRKRKVVRQPLQASSGWSLAMSSWIILQGAAPNPCLAPCISYPHRKSTPHCASISSVVSVIGKK